MSVGQPSDLSRQSLIIPSKRFFSIGEVSELTGVKMHVLRYWELEFQELKPIKRRRNRRYYQHHDVLLIGRIRELLYEKGLTINNARVELKAFSQYCIESAACSHPLDIEIIGIGRTLSEQLIKEPSLIHQLSPEQFEEFICERLFAMGFEPRQVGSTNRKDGGVDVVFWPRLNCAFPFLGAAQIKHHCNPNIKEGPASVREFAGVLAGHSFNAGLVVTNTTFSPDAEWFAREHANLLKLRGLSDIRRWLLNNFNDESEWREIPSSIELCPNVIIKIR